jgi:hypothetical protein
MTEYCMWFSTAGQVRSYEKFEADDDAAGIRIARVLYYMCSDTCESFELWDGSRKIRALQSTISTPASPI